jgi:AsmA protein
VLNADRLDMDRYRTKALASNSPSTPKKSGEANQSASSDEAKSEAPIDLSALKKLDARGDIHVGRFSASGLKAQDFNLHLNAQDGRLHLSPITAKLYGGRLSGSVAVDAQRNVFAIQQTASGIDIGPLLRDLANKDLLEGRGNVALDLHASGRTTAALKRALNGNASLMLKDGSIKGINLAALLRRAKAALGSREAAEAQAAGGEKTDFSDLSASFVIKKGVAHNDDLLMRSPFLRVSGAGDLDIGASTMDYLLKATVVGSPTGQDGKELADLQGLTVPVRVKGPLDHLKYKPDIGAIAKDAAKREIEKQLEKRLGGKGADKSNSDVDQLLRGLFKKKQ